MATFRNRHGKWQARVQRKGQQPVSKSFQSKDDAERWAKQVEVEMQKGSYTNLVLAERTTFGVYTVRSNGPRRISSCNTKNTA